MSFSDLLRVAPGSTLYLEAIEPDGTPGFEGDKAAGEDAQWPEPDEDVSGIVIPE